MVTVLQPNGLQSRWWSTAGAGAVLPFTSALDTACSPARQSQTPGRALGVQANVLAPNKHSAAAEAMWRGHLLDSETYIGGKVEALESGIFRSDLPTRFKLQPAAYQVRSCVAGRADSQLGVSHDIAQQALWAAAMLIRLASPEVMHYTHSCLVRVSLLMSCYDPGTAGQPGGRPEVCHRGGGQDVCCRHCKL
jgi:hypothetical protein